MPPFILSNIKTISYAIISIIFGSFLLWSIHNYRQKIILQEENKILLDTKQTQEAIINIHDENSKNQESLNNDIKKKIIEIEKINIKNEKDFLQKSDCIFKNFGNKDYECN